MERGTVSMRVAFVLRSAEVQPLFWDLCDAYVVQCERDTVGWLVIIQYYPSFLLFLNMMTHDVTNSLPPHNKQTNKQTNTNKKTTRLPKKQAQQTNSPPTVT